MVTSKIGRTATNRITSRQPGRSSSPGSGAARSTWSDARSRSCEGAREGSWTVLRRIVGRCAEPDARLADTDAVQTLTGTGHSPDWQADPDGVRSAPHPGPGRL